MIEIFEELREEREHICEVCGKQINNFKPLCFSHCLAKSTYPKYKYDKNNIGLVCSIDCHNKHDMLFSGVAGRLIEEYENGKHLTYNELHARLEEESK